MDSDFFDKPLVDIKINKSKNKNKNSKKYNRVHLKSTFLGIISKRLNMLHRVFLLESHKNIHKRDNINGTDN